MGTHPIFESDFDCLTDSTGVGRMTQVEPAVIDNDMLQTAVESQGPTGQAGKIAKNEGIAYNAVLSLRLDFRSILKMEYLWQFSALTKLQLDNNIIEVISGIEKMVNLTWLDLSFNHIEVIAGLDQNTKLTDLSLANNRIQHIQGLDKLTALQTLSLSNNALTELNELYYLRPTRFPKLKSVGLRGNPMTQDEDSYPAFPMAILSSLSFLDFKMIDQAERAAAVEKYEIKVKELEHKEEKEAKLRKKREEEELAIKNKTEAFVNHVASLPQKMYEEDVDGEIINQIPEIQEVVETFKTSILEVCVQIEKVGLQRMEQRKLEIEDLTASREEAIEETNAKASGIVTDFIALSEDQFHSDDIGVKINELEEELMEIEVTLNESNDESIKEFERNYSEMCGMFLEYASGQFSKIREIENLHNEKLQEDCQIQLEKFIKNDVPEEYSEEVRMRFVDKETVANALAASHDVHLLAIDTCEDSLVSQSNSSKDAFISWIQETELTRSRCRYKEIANLLDHLREELYNMED